MDGLLLAAGAGRRMGSPKALVRDDHGVAWVRTATERLMHGGCETVTVVVGAAAEEVLPLIPEGATAVLADDWATGMSASLRAGLRSLVPGTATATLVHLVDLPDVSTEVIRRVARLGDDPSVLARAACAGTPGHPVLLGRSHWNALITGATGDRGARAYLRTHEVMLVECGDLASGRDVDSPIDPQL